MRTDIYLMRLISGRSAPDENRDGKAEPSRCARFRVCVADTQLCKNAPLWHLISIALVLATGLATGCSDADGSDTDGSRVAPAVEGDRRVPFSPENDREFAEFFVEHHRAAIRMAQEEASRGESEPAKALAQGIIDTQSAELRTLEEALATLGADGSAPPIPEDPHMGADMESMATLSGSELDRMFLINMIAHHASGLAPAHRARSRLDRGDLRALAAAMFDAQAREVGEMRDLLASMDALDAGEDLATGGETRADFGLIGDRRISLTPSNDVEFIDFFISHHQAAIRMAEEVVARGDSEDVRAMAQSMREVQTVEMNMMREVRSTLTGSAEPPAMPADAYMATKMDAMMAASGSDLAGC